MVEPPNRGYFEASHVVFCREVVLFSEVQSVLVLWEWYIEECPLQRDRPFLRGSFIRGSNVDPLGTDLKGAGNLADHPILSLSQIPASLT